MTSTPDGHPTTTPADSGPDSTALITAPHIAPTAALCAQLDHLRTALAHAEHVDGHIVDILTATVAGLATAVTNTLGQQPATITVAPSRDYWQQRRIACGWTQQQVMQRLEDAAASVGVTLPARDSLQIMVSRWETGRHKMSAHYQRLFRMVYGLPTTPAVTARIEPRTPACPPYAPAPVPAHRIPTNASLGEVVKKLRRRRGMSQRICADLVGRSESWISQLERGLRSCENVNVLKDLAKVLGVTEDVLFEATQMAVVA